MKNSKFHKVIVLISMVVFTLGLTSQAVVLDYEGLAGGVIGTVDGYVHSGSIFIVDDTTLAGTLSSGPISGAMQFFSPLPQLK